MYLHKDDRELFKDLITFVSRKTNVREDIVEKDYYVTLILQELSKADYPVVFKGGTSLSKAYGVIDRFSEDVDITFTEHLGEARRKKLKYKILKPIGENMGLSIINWDTIESDKDLNHYDFSYESVVNNFNDGIPSIVKVETSLMSYSFPTNVCKITNYLYESLNGIEDNLLRDYKLFPFEMKVQALERTFIDKIFAVGDYYLLGKPNRNARHLYDIYKLQEHITFDENFLKLVDEVRKHRTTLGEKISPTANFNVDMTKLCLDIFDKEFYKKDYDATTIFMISDQIDYETVKENYIKVITKIWK